MKSVAVVICNFNKKTFLLNNLESVFASTFTDFDVIVVDNASEDGSAEAVREQYDGKLTLLVNPENTGGSGGFNRGMEYALDKGYKYIHLLDNDIILDKKCIGELYEFMENNPGTGACGSLILNMEQPDFIQDYGSMIEIENLGVKPLFHAQKVSDALPDVIECDYVAACSAMYRVSVLEKTGVIDKSYFIYWDDMSLSWEIRLAGYKVNACKRSKVWHMHSYEPHNTFGLYYFFRNKLYSLVKYSSDDEYGRLCEHLVQRLFRIFAANKDNPEIISTYFHALDDALNNVRNKAEEHIIKPISKVNASFKETFSEKKNILLICKTYDFDFKKLIRKFKSVTDAEITIHNDGREIPEIEGINYVLDADISLYDAVINLCPHVLDEGKYDRRYKYIDRYMNQILTADDFDFVENLESNYAFFRNVFYDFIKSKLEILRKKVRANEYENFRYNTDLQ